MKKSFTFSLIVVALASLLFTGCASVNSGNFAKRNMSLPYDQGNAVTTKTVKDIDSCGRTTTHIEELVQTPVAVNKDITVEQLRDSRDAYTAQAKGSSGNSFWSGVFGPTTYPSGYNGSYYGQSYYGNTSGNVGWVTPYGATSW